MAPGPSDNLNSRNSVDFNLSHTALHNGSISLPATQHTSAQFIESAGALLFNSAPSSPTPSICLLHLLARNEYILPKGRVNQGESRQDAAVREVHEEAGYTCHLLPVTVRSRAPPPMDDEVGATPDVARVYEMSTEPFALQIRHLDAEGSVKLIWWFVAVVDEGEEMGTGEERFEVGFYGFEDAEGRLTFQGDRDLVR